MYGVIRAVILLSEEGTPLPEEEEYTSLSTADCSDDEEFNIHLLG